MTVFGWPPRGWPQGLKRITKLLLIREGVHSQLVSFVEKKFNYLYCFQKEHLIDPLPIFWEHDALPPT